MLKCYVKVKCILCSKKGFGVQEVLGIATMFIIAGFILIPGMQQLAQTAIDGLKEWFGDIISVKIFPDTKPTV